MAWYHRWPRNIDWLECVLASDLWNHPSAINARKVCLRDTTTLWRVDARSSAPFPPTCFRPIQRFLFRCPCVRKARVGCLRTCDDSRYSLRNQELEEV